MPTDCHGWCPTQTCGLLNKKKFLNEMDKAKHNYFFSSEKHFFLLFVLFSKFAFLYKTKNKIFFQNLKAYTEIFPKDNCTNKVIPLNVVFSAILKI